MAVEPGPELGLALDSRPPVLESERATQQILALVLVLGPGPGLAWDAKTTARPRLDERSEGPSDWRYAAAAKC